MILNPNAPRLPDFPVPTLPIRRHLPLALLPGLLFGAVPGHAAVALADTTRTYFVAAEEVDWNYAPAGRDEMMGRPFGPGDSVFVAAGAGRIGATYRKAVYREYTDSTFTVRKPVPSEWRHKGLLGPVLRAEVGDTIRVVFRNRASRPYTMHPHGVLYDKASEGAPTNDGTSGAATADDAVAPGASHTYLWAVPERAGPAPSGPSSTVWLYHSHVSEPADTNAGLIGAIVVTRRGMADGAGRPTDVDREFVALFKVFDENASWYLDENVRAAGLDEAPDEEGNLMHAINGLVYGSLPLMSMRRGERVRWYLLDLGTEVDLHTAHWHGNVADVQGRRTDVVELMPGSMKVADMVADNPGTWMFHCHVDDHITAGMTGRYRVLPADGATDDDDPPPEAFPAAEAASAGTDSGPVWIERQTVRMGTRLRVRVAAADRDAGVAASERTFREVGRMEALLSTWTPDSELARLNAAAVGSRVRPSVRLGRLLAEAEDWARRTDRAFDPAVGALVDAWDLRGEGREPPPATLATALAATGRGGISIDPASGAAPVVTRLEAPGWIDAGGFGKGAALRAARNVLAGSGIRRALVDLGGQLLVVGGGPEGAGWPVAVAHPVERDRPVARLRVADVSVATSGLSERPGHILDPRTGHPVPAWGSVTVVSPDPLAADALSTALYVMGPDEGLEWAREHTDAAVLFLEDDAGVVRARWNDAMDAWLERAPVAEPKARAHSNEFNPSPDRGGEPR